MTVGRLAPSPTGLLHLGNAWAFWLAWLAARAEHGQIILRLEDLDPQRSKPEYSAKIIEDLRWLGLDWDAGPATPQADPEDWQSNNDQRYFSALTQLQGRNLAYACYCTRKELRELASAPQVERVPYAHLQNWVGDAGARYSGACRGLGLEQKAALAAAGRKPAWRLACPQEYQAQITDLILGPQSFDLGPEQDFLLQRSDGVWAYHLAVCLDDAARQVTQVVRGNDILASTGCQLLLYELLDLQPRPQYAHLPLLHDAQGQRLSKRQRGLSLEALRQAGVSADQLVGYLAKLAGLSEGGRKSAPETLASLQGRALPWHLLRQPALQVPDQLEDLLKEI